MKKIFKILIVFFAILCIIPVSSCTRNADCVTGGACSIKDLAAPEKNVNSHEKVSLGQERNLRPVNLSPEITNPCDSYCIFGMTLQKIVLEK